MVLAGIRKAHGGMAQALQQGQDAGDDAHGGGVADTEEPAQHGMSGVAAQPDQRDQQVVAPIEDENAPSADGAAALRPAMALVLFGLVMGQEATQQAVELGQR